ncbi:MAG: hypothetical protein P8J14_11455 [Emcibacteraceae bacterium]|nr:hypothetical protein [Emcibacteraceae bacterium]
MFLRFSLLFAIIIQTSIVSAQDIQTGSFRITSTSEEILGKATASDFEKQLDIDEEIQWQVYVPKTYDPYNPPGILLYQTYKNYSGMRRGKIEDPTGWKSAMDERNMILIRIISKGGEYP